MRRSREDRGSPPPSPSWNFLHLQIYSIIAENTPPPPAPQTFWNISGVSWKNFQTFDFKNNLSRINQTDNYNFPFFSYLRGWRSYLHKNRSFSLLFEVCLQMTTNKFIPQQIVTWYRIFTRKHVYLKCNKAVDLLNKY